MGLRFRRLLAALLLGVLFGLVSLPVEASRRDGNYVQTLARIRSADVVFLGRVLSVTDLRDTPNPPPEFRHSRLPKIVIPPGAPPQVPEGDPTFRYQIRVVDTWHRDLPETVEVFTTGNEALVRLKVGTTQFVYAWNRPDGSFLTAYGMIDDAWRDAPFELLDKIENWNDIERRHEFVEEELLRTLDPAHPMHSRKALHVLQHFGPGSPQIVTRLIDELPDAETSVQEGIVNLLGRWAETDRRIPNVILSLHDHPDPRLRKKLPWILGREEFPRSDERERVLDGLLRDPDAEVRIAAVRTLDDHPGDLEARVRLLHPLLSDPDASVRSLALRTSVVNTDNKWDPAARPVIESAFRLLDDPDEIVRASALRFLREMADAFPEALPRFFAATNDESKRVRIAAYSALLYYSKDTPGLVRQYLHGLNDPDASVRKTAARGLATCHTSTWGRDPQDPAPWPEEVAPTLQALVTDQSVGIVREGTAALAALLPDQNIESFLLKLPFLAPSDNPCLYFRELAHGVKDREFLRKLSRRAIADPSLRSCAVPSAAHFARGDEALQAAVVALLSDNDPEIRLEAVLGVAEWVPFDTNARGYLEARTEDRDARVRRLAEWMLRLTSEEAGMPEHYEEWLETRAQGFTVD